MDGYKIRTCGIKDGRETKQDVSSRNMGDCFSFYISIFAKVSILRIVGFYLL